MERLIWVLVVIVLSILASVLGSFVAWLIRGSTKAERAHQTRNAPKGVAAVVFWVFAGLGCGVLTLLFGCSLVMILVDPFGEHGPKPPAPPPPPKQPLGPLAEDLGPPGKQTLILGGHADVPFRELAPDGGLLTGFDVGLGEDFNVELVKSIQPRFQTAKGEVQGRRFGAEYPKIVTAKAKAGYAVGAINVKAGLWVNGFSITFMRVKGATLDPKDRYSSAWIGDQTGGGPPVLLGGDGTPIVGIIGKRTAEICTGLGLLKR